MKSEHMKPGYMTRKDAADYLRMSVKTLANLAAKSQGPAFTKPGGKVTLYTQASLDEWAAQRG